MFGEKDVYNPWSILNYVEETANKTAKFPKPYWSNTSSNTVVRELIERGDCDGFADFLSGQLMDTISFFDYKESYYHGFLAGILKCFDRYVIYSNREAGTGRSDIMMRETVFRGRGIILELKITSDIDEMEKKCDEALEQIEIMQYEKQLRKEGCKEILKYGVCFFKKGCMVKKA